MGEGCGAVCAPRSVALGAAVSAPFHIREASGGGPGGGHLRMGQQRRCPPPDWPCAGRACMGVGPAEGRGAGRQRREGRAGSGGGKPLGGRGGRQMRGHVRRFECCVPPAPYEFDQCSAGTRDAYSWGGGVPSQSPPAMTKFGRPISTTLTIATKKKRISDPPPQRTCSRSAHSVSQFDGPRETL